MLKLTTYILGNKDNKSIIEFQESSSVDQIFKEFVSHIIIQSDLSSISNLDNYELEKPYYTYDISFNSISNIAIEMNISKRQVETGNTMHEVRLLKTNSRRIYPIYEISFINANIIEWKSQGISSRLFYKSRNEFIDAYKFDNHSLLIDKQ